MCIEISVYVKFSLWLVYVCLLSPHEQNVKLYNRSDNNNGNIVHIYIIYYDVVYTIKRAWKLCYDFSFDAIGYLWNRFFFTWAYAPISISRSLSFKIIVNYNNPYTHINPFIIYSNCCLLLLLLSTIIKNNFVSSFIRVWIYISCDVTITAYVLHICHDNYKIYCFPCENIRGYPSE